MAVGNFMAVKQEVAYTLSPPILVNAAPADTSTPEPTPTPIPGQPTPVPTPVAVPNSDESRVIIAKIGVNTPLIMDVPGEITEQFLNKGVAHLQGSAYPGQTGNVFVTGHSSDYPWHFNKYASVFALLPKLSGGDDITLQYHNQYFHYKVSSTEIVTPDRLDIINNTATPVVTLMTCYPIGTTQKRFVVHARLVN